MSKIIDIRDKIDSIVSTTLSTYVKLKNPYIIENDADTRFPSGYAVRISDGLNLLESPDSGKSQRQRDYIVVLTARIFGTKHDTTVIESTINDLFEDQHLMIKAIEEENTMRSGQLAMTAEYISDGGIEFFRVGRNDTVAIQSTIQVQLHEKYSF